MTTGDPPANPNQALWEKGDFTRIAASMRESGEAFVQGLGVAKGMRVLDLGCGDGTTAIPEARLGADVLGVDIARNLVEAGSQGGVRAVRGSRRSRNEGNGVISFGDELTAAGGLYLALAAEDEP